jgi:hypothetical protein
VRVVTDAGQHTDQGPVKVLFDASPPDGGPGMLLAFVEGPESLRLGRHLDRRLGERVVRHDRLGGFIRGYAQVECAQVA